MAALKAGGGSAPLRNHVPQWPLTPVLLVVHASSQLWLWRVPTTRSLSRFVSNESTSSIPVLVSRPWAELNSQSTQPLAFMNTSPSAFLANTNRSDGCCGDSQTPSAVSGQLDVVGAAWAMSTSGGQYSWHGVS